MASQASTKQAPPPEEAAELVEELEHLKRRIQALEPSDGVAAGTANAWGNARQLAAMLQTAGDAILCLDGGKRVRLFNKQAESLFGYHTDEVVGEPLASLIRPALKEGAGGVRDTAPTLFLEAAAERPVEVSVVRRDGAQVPAELTVGYFELNGETTWTLVLRDLSDRKIAEQTLIAAKNEAEIANRTKSEFLANMSHELRNPLNAIIGFSEILESESLGPLGVPDYRDYVGSIHSSGRHLLKLINDIVDMSKIEVGKLALNEEVVDVLDLASSCLTLMGGPARSGNVTLLRDTPDELPLLLADIRMLKQIIVNLLSNAVKFTPAGGTITLRAWSRDQDGYVLQIADSGIGMKLEDIPKAMIRFSQDASPISRKFEGNGLGLPLTKSLIELHGGSLDVQSKVGAGTTVTIRFPAERIVRDI